MYRTFLSRRYFLTRRINLIGVVGIFLAVGALVVILSIMTGFLEASRSAIRGSLSDIVIAPIHLPRIDGREVPKDPARILAVVRSDPRVESASARLGWYGVVSQDPTTDGERFRDPEKLQENIVSLLGIDVADELATTDLGASLTREPGAAGRRVTDPERPFDAAGAPEGAKVVVVGEQLLERLDLEVGGTLRVLTWIPDRGASSLEHLQGEFYIAGTFRSSENEMDLDRVYLDREVLREFVGEARSFSEVNLRLVDYESMVDPLLSDLKSSLGALGLIRGRSREVKSWEQFRTSLLGSINNQRSVMAILLSLVVLVAGFTVFAIISMMVKEKTRDIGVLRALGAERRGVLSLFVLIGCWDALVGGLGGALGGIWAARNIDGLERWLSSTLGLQIFDRNVYLFDHIPTRISATGLIWILALTLLVIVIFSALPAWRASRVDPLTALRQE